MCVLVWILPDKSACHISVNIMLELDIRNPSFVDNTSVVVKGEGGVSTALERSISLWNKLHTVL